MTDIVINGVSLEELSRQRAEMQKGAVRWIAVELNGIQNLLDKFDDENFTLEEAEEIAPIIKGVLDNIQKVSDATGVEYSFEWYGVDEPYYNQDKLSYKEYRSNFPNLIALETTLGDIRYQQSVWNGSNC